MDDSLDAVAREIVACARRTLLANGARIELRDDWTWSDRPARDTVRRRRRGGGLLALLRRLAVRAIKASWKRATRDLDLGHMVGEGIVEPVTGRFMIDFGAFAQIETTSESFGGRSGRALSTLEPFSTSGASADMLWLLRLLPGSAVGVARRAPGVALHLRDGHRKERPLLRDPSHTA
jgi:hypothetical protein